MIPSRSSEDMALVASLPIRNRATLAGNLINASPIGDMTNLLMALGARVVLAQRRGAPAHETRELPLEALYLGYKTLAMESDEVVREICFEVGATRSGATRSASRRSPRGRWLGHRLGL